jgi:nitronate monooxygenase
MLGIDFPIIMAPMFLVSNAAMVIAAAKEGVTGAIPALNYRTEKDLRDALAFIKQNIDGPFGINLIANKSNYKFPYQLQACLDYEVDYIITSLGSPQKIIDACKPKGIKVFTDVIDLKYAKKCESMGADALIAVNNQAGGHLGPMDPNELIPLLRRECNLPVISAGGVGTGKQLKEKLELGACGASIGSLFIASEESDVAREYKQACVDYGKDDIVVSTKISGTPCTVINTPYVQQIGTKQNWLEATLAKNKTLKKWVKMITYFKGMKAIENAAFSATYKTVWCAGPTIEYIHDIQPAGEIIQRLRKEYFESLDSR